MDRRDFITVSAGAAVTMTVLPPSAQASGGTDTVIEPPSDMGEYVARVDAGLERIGRWSLTTDAREAPADRAATDRLAQISLQSLFMTGMLGDLPIHQQLDERMQARVERMTPVFDEAVDGMTAYLGSRTAADLEAAARNLRRPGAVERIVDTIEREAGRTGVSSPRRRQLRDMLEHVAWRLTNQPPSLVVTEYLDKVDRAAQSDIGSESRQRALAARIGEEVFWEDDTQRTRRQRTQARGAKVLGIGVVVFAVSGGLVAAGAFPFVFGMTVGAVMMLVGLIMLLAATGMPKTDADTASARP